MKRKTKMSRIIREHRVFGKAFVVSATSDVEARAKAFLLAKPKMGQEIYIWEMKELFLNTWECYIAKHEDVFAMND